MHRTSLIGTAVSLSLILLGAVTVAYAADVNGCTTINEPGLHVLVRTFTAAPQNFSPAVENQVGCIVIAADFVTLDMAGNTIIGPGTCSNCVGIATDRDRRGATVRDGTVTGFKNGVQLIGSGPTIEHVRAIANSGIGIIVGSNIFATASSIGGRVVGNSAVNNLFGGILVQCPAVVLENIAVSSGGFSHIEAPPGPGPAPCTLLQNSPAP